MKNNINERVRHLIKFVTTESRRFKELEELTDISTATWKTFWNRGSNPSAQMLESICQKWPEHAFWLATGMTDEIAGHVGVGVAKDLTLDYLGVWSERVLPYARTLFVETRGLKKRIDEGIAKIGDSGISTAERSTFRSTEEMRMKEVEHQISMLRERRVEEVVGRHQEIFDISENLPNFSRIKEEKNGNQ
ncbi:MAG: hypothetical protein V4695_10870 [Pseudomonadota bacterium]